jgi:acyl carrier protein
MADVRSRLEQCFAAVFPDLPREELPRASAMTVPGWDSLAHATLISVIEEEFGVEVPPDDLAELNAFALLQDYLQSELGVA